MFCDECRKRFGIFPYDKREMPDAKMKGVGEVGMSEWHSVDFAPQGWQCPICKRVYSPMTTMCYYCGNGVATTKTSTTGDAVIDWLHHESITKAEKPKEGR